MRSSRQRATPVAKFSLATNERFEDCSGEWQERVEWHSIVAWQRLAEIVGEFVTTGSKVYIEGKLQTSNWEDRQSGERRYRTEIARKIVLLGSRVNGQEEKGEVPGVESSPESAPAETEDSVPF